MDRSPYSVYPSSILDRTLRIRQSEYDAGTKSPKNARVLADRLLLCENDALAGAVDVSRDRIEVTRLTGGLTGVWYMVGIIQAYTREFTNKLCVIPGLLQIGKSEWAQ